MFMPVDSMLGYDDQFFQQGKLVGQENGGDLNNTKTFLNKLIDKHKKSRVEKAAKEAIKEDPTGKRAVDIYEKTIEFLATGAKDKNIKKLSDKIDKKLSKVIDGNVGESETYKSFKFDEVQIKRFIELKNQIKLPVGTDSDQPVNPAEMSISDIEDYIDNEIHKHKAPGRPRKVVKETIKSDPSGKKVVDLYQMVTRYLADGGDSTSIQVLYKELEARFLDSKPDHEQLIRYEKLKAEFHEGDADENADEFFAKHCHKLKDFSVIEAEVNANGQKLAKKIGNKINYHLAKNLQKKVLKSDLGEITKDKFRAYEHNRTGRNLDGIILNATDVQTERQAYICSALVKDAKIAQDYFTGALDQNTSVFVSLHEYRDGKGRCPDFWCNNVFLQFPDENGWKIVNEQSEVVEQSKIKEDAQIIESKLVAKRGDETRNITHFHYAGWKDHKDAPDEQLLLALINRIKSLDIPDNHPIAVNCKAGVGRTGLTVAVHYLQKEIDKQLANGVDLDDVEINIPEAVYRFRNQRVSLLGNYNNMAQLYTIIASYYKTLKA